MHSPRVQADTGLVIITLSPTPFRFLQASFSRAAQTVGCRAGVVLRLRSKDRTAPDASPNARQLGPLIREGFDEARARDLRHYLTRRTPTPTGGIATSSKPVSRSEMH